jgi:hypothetical protein
MDHPRDCNPRIILWFSTEVFQQDLASLKSRKRQSTYPPHLSAMERARKTYPGVSRRGALRLAIGQAHRVVRGAVCLCVRLEDGQWVLVLGRWRGIGQKDDVDRPGRKSG